jgi:hypothetical protein
MVKVSYETGKVQEIESGFVHGKIHYHSHVLLKRADGEAVRLADVAVEDYINGAVEVGRSCTIAFLNHKGRAPRPYESQIFGTPLSVLPRQTAMCHECPGAELLPLSELRDFRIGCSAHHDDRRQRSPDGLAVYRAADDSHVWFSRASELEHRKER